MAANEDTHDPNYDCIEVHELYFDMDFASDPQLVFVYERISGGIGRSSNDFL